MARLLLPAIAALALVLMVPLPGRAAPTGTFTVTRFDDRSSGNCTPGDCALREAVIAANADAGPSVILLPAGTYSLTIPGRGEDFAATGDLDLRAAITISSTGGTAVVDAAGIDRVLDLPAGTAVVTLAGMTLRHGDSLVEAGGGLQVTAGAVLTVTDSAILDNHAMSYAGGVAVHGGAQANFVHTTIAYNEVALNGAQFSGLLCSGGGILSGGTVVLNASSVLSNTVYASSESPCGTIGGGIDNEGSLLITESTVAYNISHDAFYSPTVPGWAFAGGIYNASSATLRVENSTISRNLTRQDHAGPPLANGGGLLNYGQATMNNVTIAENSAESPSADAYGGGVNVASGWLALGNTIIAGNHVAGDVPEHGPDCLFTLSSQDYNLIGITAGCTITGTVAHNLYDLDARLGPLQDNGGPTWTHGLLAGSPAIHHGDNGTCAPVDQRGIARPQGCVCDIGAFEVVMPWLWFNPIFAQAPVVP